MPTIFAKIASLRTEMRRRRRKLELSEARYQQLFEESPAANFVSTPAGRLIACNDNFVRLFGFRSMEDAFATPTQRLYADPAARAAGLERLLRDGRLDELELEMRRQDGSTIVVHSSVVARFDERGDVAEIHGYLIDMTEPRRLAEEFRQAQKMESIGRLAGGMAHDFNNMLTVIIASADVALDELEARHPAREPLSEVAVAARRAAELTGQLLSFARRQPLMPADCDVGAIFEGFTPLVRRLVGEDVELVVEGPPGRRLVRVDRHQLEQAVMNLAANARDAMPDGGTLRISVDDVSIDETWSLAHPGSRVGDYCRIRMRDSGIGMNEATRKLASEPFFTTKGAGKGTGLGLSIVFGFVKQSDGYMAIESQPGTGTTVSLYLPVAERAGAPGDAPTLPVRPADPPRGQGFATRSPPSPAR